MRGRRFLGFTNEGQRIIEWAERVISQRDAMLVELSGMRENYEGRLRLGAMPNSSPVLPLFSQLLSKKHSGVQVDIRFLGIEQTRLGLSNFSLDIGITYLNQGELAGLNTMPIYDERLSLLVPDVEEYRGFPPFCPHMEEPLDQSGMLAQGRLTCSKHLWQWDPRSGDLIGEMEKALLFYDVKRGGDDILANIEEELCYEYDEEDEYDDADFFSAN